MTLSDTEKEEAINYLRTQISLDTLWQVYTHRDAPTWLNSQHFGLGLWARNALRAAGFGWDDLTLDVEWPALILAVVERTAKDEAWL